MDLFAKIKKSKPSSQAAKSEGERQAAELARNRILERKQQEVVAQPLEYRISLGNLWKKKLFVALCNKYNIRTYRYKGQKHTTVGLRATKAFIDTVLFKSAITVCCINL